MSQTFHSKEIKVDGRTINLQYKPIKDIIEFGSVPIFVMGDAGTGKSVLMLDVLHKFGPDATKIFFVTETFESKENSILTSLHNMYKYYPTIDNLIAIYEEIRFSSRYSHFKPPDIKDLFCKLYSKEAMNEVKKEIESIKTELMETVYAKNSSDTKINTDIDVLLIESLGRMIVAKVKEDPNRLIKLSEDDINLCKGLESVSPKIIFIIDDSTTQLGAMCTNTKHKVNFDGHVVSEKDAFFQILQDLLTRGRHYNAIMLICAHNASFSQGLGKDSFGNFIFMNSGVINSIARFSSIDPSLKGNTVKVLANELWGYDNTKNKHHCLVVRNKSDWFVTKADLNDKLPKFNEMDEKIQDIYNKINEGDSVSFDSSESEDSGEELTIEEEI